MLCLTRLQPSALTRSDAAVTRRPASAGVTAVPGVAHGSRARPHGCASPLQCLLHKCSLTLACLCRCAVHAVTCRCRRGDVE